MAGPPPWDTAVHSSHAPGVGAREPRASAATRRVEGAATTATTDGLDQIFWVVLLRVWKSWRKFAAGGAARDRGRLAPAGVQALLGMDESAPTWSAQDQDGASSSDSADELRASALRCAEDP